MADRLRHILQAIADIQAYTAGKTFDDYLVDDMRRQAIERCLEILSEASRHVPPEAKARHPNLPWRGVADFGNVLRHDYPSVKDRRVWEIVTSDLVPLKAAVESMLGGVETKEREQQSTAHGPPTHGAASLRRIAVVVEPAGEAEG